MSALPALIEKLSALQGPSREVDARIHYAIFPETEVLLDPGDMRTKRPGRRGKLSEMPIDGWTDYDAICHHIGAGRYTESLDAAIALIERVLPGANRTVRKRYRTTNGRIDGHKYDAQVSGGDVCEGFNEAAALLIATLRALEAKETGR